MNQIQGAAVRRARLPRRLGVRLGVRDVHLMLRRRLRGVGRLQLTNVMRLYKPGHDILWGSSA